MNTHERVEFLLMCLNAGGFVGVFGILKGNDAWDSHCYENGSEDAETLIETWMNENLSNRVIEDIALRQHQRELVIEYNEIVSSDSDLEAAQRLDAWCQGDAFTERHQLWLNEY